MSKLPYMQFYPGDWMQDTRALSLAAKGAWIDLLCAMWNSQTRGVLTLPWVGLARLIGATVDQTKAVIAELVEMGVCDCEVADRSTSSVAGHSDQGCARADHAASQCRGMVGPISDVTPCNSDVTPHVTDMVTLINRRMVREEIAREKARLRVQKHRAKKAEGARNGPCNGACNGDVTPYIPDTRSQKPEDKIISPDGDMSPAVADDAPAATKPGSNGKGKSGPPPCPHEAIVALYHETLPELPRVKTWPEHRRKLLRSRWREDKDRQNLDWWRDYFAQVRACPFLMGQVPGREGRAFHADLEWLIRPRNMPKVLEGRYLDTRPPAAKEAETHASQYDEL